MAIFQSADIAYLTALAVSYLFACAAWLGLDRAFDGLWKKDSEGRSDNPWGDLGLAVIAVLAVVGLQQLRRQGHLFDEGSTSLWWCINQIVVYSPVLAASLGRGQGSASLYLSFSGLLGKLLVGVLLGFCAAAVFLLLRGEAAEIPRLLVYATHPKWLVRFPPIFLEVVGVSFLYIRLRWALGPWPALVIPSVVFAIYHIPRGIEAGGSPLALMAFVLFNTLLLPVVLHVIHRSKDVIWLGLVHFFLWVAVYAA